MPPEVHSYAGVPAAARVRCPLAADPRPECYCYEMNSADIPDMQRFCGRNHRQCRIYRENLQAEAAGLFEPDLAGAPDGSEP